MQFQSALEIPGDVARATEVVRVLVKYGLARWLEGTDWGLARRILTSHTGEILTDKPLAVRLRLALTDLGTTYIKLGQILSTRPDLVGPEVTDELSHLQSGTPPDSPEVAIATIEHELSRPIAECFVEFDKNAMASASIGQVHRAKLPNGRRVVVKVQHAGIEGTIHRDLNILAKLATYADDHEDLKRYRPSAVVREFRETIMRELDFRREMRNLQQFRRNFAADHTVAFPRPYPQLSTGRVLTMQMFSGTSVGNIEQLKRRNIELQELARHGAGVFVQMILRDGFYHADPHPGNILVLRAGRVGIIDAGMVGRLDDELREQVVGMILAIGDGNADLLVDLIAEACKAPPDLDRGSLKADLGEIFNEYGTQAVGNFPVGDVLNAITRLMHDYNVFMPTRLSMLIRCLVELEGTARSLNASFNLYELLEPYRRQFMVQQLSPERWLRKVRRQRRDWELLVETIPRSISGLLEKMQTGNLTIRIRHPSLETALNRLVYGLCTSALLLASAVLWVHQVPPTRGVWALGAAGYLIAGFLALRVMWRTPWRGRNDDD